MQIIASDPHQRTFPTPHIWQTYWLIEPTMPASGICGCIPSQKKHVFETLKVFRPFPTFIFLYFALRLPSMEDHRPRISLCNMRLVRIPSRYIAALKPLMSPWCAPQDPLKQHTTLVVDCGLQTWILGYIYIFVSFRNKGFFVTIFFWGGGQVGDMCMKQILFIDCSWMCGRSNVRTWFYVGRSNVLWWSSVDWRKRKAFIFFIYWLFIDMSFFFSLSY